MIVDYTFPALLNAVPPGHRAPRNVLARFRDSVDVPEISSEDATVACELRWMGARKLYRYMDGGFYLEGDSLETRLPGEFPSHLQRAMDFDILLEISAFPGTGRPDVWPEMAVQVLRDVGKRAGDGDGLDTPDFAGMARDDGLFQTASKLSGVDRDEVNRWREVAARRARSMFVLDGALWVRTEEPCFRCVYEGSRPAGTCMLGNFALYRAPGNRVLFRKPSDAWFVNVESRLKSDRLVDFWNPHVSVVPISLIDEVKARMEATRHPTAALRLMDLAKSDIRMPEVFGVGHDDLELDRRARMSVALYSGPLRKMASLGGMERQAAGALRRLKAAVATYAIGTVPPEGLDDLVEEAAEVWREAYGRTPRTVTTAFASHLAGVETAVRRWRERPIELGMGNVSPAPGARP